MEDSDRYLTFWKEFGKALKLGIIEDASNRNRLAKLLRFYTSKSSDKMTDLEDYIGRMKEGQKHIYYLTGEQPEHIRGSLCLGPIVQVINAHDPLACVNQGHKHGITSQQFQRQRNMESVVL